MGIVRESKSIRSGNAHLFCHAEWEEATSGISRHEDLWLKSDTWGWWKGSESRKTQTYYSCLRLICATCSAYCLITKGCSINKRLSQFYLHRCWKITQTPWMLPLSLNLSGHCFLLQHVIGDRSGEERVLQKLERRDQADGSVALPQCRGCEGKKERVSLNLNWICLEVYEKKGYMGLLRCNTSSGHWKKIVERPHCQSAILLIQPWPTVRWNIDAPPSPHPPANQATHNN